MPTRRDFLFGATAVVAGGLLLPAVATTAAAAPPSDADRQAADRAFDRERLDRQSPINIVTADVVVPPNALTLVIDYPTSVDLEVEYVRMDQTMPDGCSVRHPEETVEAVVPAGAASVRLDGRRWDLLQFHFHTPSEHKVDGQSTPMEQHFVHENPETGRLLVLGLFLRRGGSNTVQDRVLRVLPQECGEHIDLAGVNLCRSLPDDLTSYGYGGSLTTESFAEGVR